MPLGAGCNKFRPQCLDHCCPSPAVASWFVVPCSWQGVCISMGGQHAHDRLTLCTGVGVSLRFALQKLEITQAIPISLIPSGEAESAAAKLQAQTLWAPGELELP